MKGLLTITLVLIASLFTVAQENKLHSSDFWAAKPDLNQVKTLIAEGHDPVALNQNAFDATVYAILRKADNDVIKYLLQMDGNSPNKKTHDSRIYLHWAAYSNNLEIVTYLLDAGASVTDLDSHGNTPLTFAANGGLKNVAIYEAFQSNGVDLTKEKNDNGANLLLLIASKLNNEKELNQFLSYGLSLDSKDKNGNNLFHYAASKGNISFLKLLIEKGVRYDALNKNGGNAILMASRGARGHQNSIELYQFLESLGLKVNVVGDNGRNPLHTIASRTENIELVDYFLNYGVDVNLQDDRGRSPFMNAASRNSLEIIKHLHKHLTDINARDNNGQTALSMAVQGNSPKVVSYLIANNAATDVIDEKGNNLAYYLINSYRLKDVEKFESKFALLESKGVSMNAAQENGNTLLHFAVLKGDMSLIKRLSNIGIDVNVKNDEGMTALHLAAMKAKDDTIIKYLISQGADIQIKTDFEESVYDLAIENEILVNKNIPLNFLK